jgi:integrase
MPRRNTPPYVQVVRRNAKIVGYRGWWMRGEKRVFGPLRETADEAHADAMNRRRAIDATPEWGGAFETRAKEWLQAIAVRVTADSLEFCRGKLTNLYRTIPKSMPVDRITPPVIREFVREAREEHALSARTIQHCRRVLNAFFRWLIRRGFVTANPCEQVEWPTPEETRPDVFRREELVALLARITDPWAQAIALFLACTGLRRAEVCRLRVQDIDAAQRMLWVRGKTRTQAHPIAGDADDAVKLLLAAADGREFLIGGSTDRARRNVVAETFRKWQKTLGEPRWHPHALRHSYVSIMLADGATNAQGQRAARHASFATTQRYANLIADDVRAAQSRLRLVPKVDEAAHG